MAREVISLDPVKLTQSLIRCPSVTPEDSGALQVLIDVLEPLGFECHSLPFENISNLYATIGSGKPHICFCGHTDVVPVGDEGSWTYPPFDAVIKNNVLYGRGAVDMKSGIACFVAAVAAHLKENDSLSGTISLLITGDEEAEAVNGTVKVLEWLEEQDRIPDVFLIGEPTNPTKLGEEIKIGRRGSLNGKISVTGRQGHTAYPNIADNPLPRLIKLADALAGYEFDSGTEHFQPTNLEFTTIDVGNPAANVIPAAGRAAFNVRFNDKWNARTLESRIREVMDSISNDYTLECVSNAESFLAEPGPFTSVVADTVEYITGSRPSLTTNGGTSDARFCVNYAPVVECGLINKTAHHVDEHAEIDAIIQLAEIYAEILRRFF